MGRNVKVTDPIVSGVEPVEEIEVEPFHYRDRTDDELADYDLGFETGQAGKPNDDTKTPAWQRGWADAQE